MNEIDLPLTTRSRTYGRLVAVVVGMLAVGLALPAIVGERPEELALRGEESFDVDALGAGTASDPAAPSGGGSGIDDGTSGAPAAGGTTGGGSTGAGGGTAPGSGTTPGAVPGAPGGPGTTVPGAATTIPVERTASDVGVTPDTIELGLLVPTADGIGSTADQRDVQIAQFRAFVDDINARGGIHGRRIELVHASYDVLDQDTGTRASCLALADDEQVFAALNTTGYGPPGALCLTREKGVPFLQGSGHPEEIYAQAAGLYSSTFDNQTRNFRNMVQTVHDLGALNGRKVGVLGTEWIGLRREQEEGIVHTLQALGYDPFVYWLSGDPVSSQTQIPIAVQQMRRNGVEVVMLGADFVSGQSFVQLAAGQNYTPLYTAADPWSYTTDQVVSGMPATFDGAVSVTAWRSYDHRAGLAQPAVDAECEAIFEASTGIQLDRTNDPDALYTGTLLACGVVRRFEAAALAAGPNPTRAGLAAAITGLGQRELPFVGGSGTYGPGKLDGADFYRPQVWRASCTCWQPLVPDFARGKH